MVHSPELLDAPCAWPRTGRGDDDNQHRNLVLIWLDTTKLRKPFADDKELGNTWSMDGRNRAALSPAGSGQAVDTAWSLHRMQRPARVWGRGFCSCSLQPSTFLGLSQDNGQSLGGTRASGFEVLDSSFFNFVY